MFPPIRFCLFYVMRMTDNRPNLRLVEALYRSPRITKSEAGLDLPIQTDLDYQIKMESLREAVCFTMLEC